MTTGTMKAKELLALVEKQIGGIIRGIEISDVTFEYQNFRFAHFEECTFANVVFNNCGLEFSKFEKCSMNGEIKFNYCSMLNLKVESSTVSTFFANNSMATNLVINDSNIENLEFSRCCLRESIFRGSTIYSANLYSCNFSSSLFSQTQFKKPVLGSGSCSWDYADLSELDNVSDIFLRLPRPIVPESGEFYGFKKVTTLDSYYEPLIAYLRVPAKAKRTSALGRKCRVSEAKVIWIKDYNGKEYKQARSTHDPEFIYNVGQIVKPHVFDPNRFNECSGGIHLFLTYNEAKEY